MSNVHENSMQSNVPSAALIRDDTVNSMAGPDIIHDFITDLVSDKLPVGVIG